MMSCGTPGSSTGARPTSRVTIPQSSSPTAPVASGAARDTRGTTASAVVFVDAEHGFLGGRRRFAWTNDGGRTWRTRSHPDGTIVSLDAVDRRHVWALAQRRGDERVSLERSVDGGRNWSEKPGLTFASISMADVHDGWAVTGAGPSGFTSEPLLGGEGILMRTATGGRTWSVVPISAQSVCAVSDSVAWAASRTTVMRTLDDGRTWSFDRLYSPRFYFTGDIGSATRSMPTPGRSRSLRPRARSSSGRAMRVEPPRSRRPRTRAGRSSTPGSRHGVGAPNVPTRSRSSTPDAGGFSSARPPVPPCSGPTMAAAPGTGSRGSDEAAGVGAGG